MSTAVRIDARGATALPKYYSRSMDPQPLHPQDRVEPLEGAASLLERAVWVAATVVVIGCLLHGLGSIPPGLYIDETAIGYDARALLLTGADQYGERFPLFFRSLDDYKSTVFTYAVALSEAVLGPTPFAVRVPAVGFALVTAVALWALLRSLTGRPVLSRWMALASLVIPSTFVYARLGMSEAGAFVAFLTVALLALRRLEVEPSWWRAAVAGAALASCVYTYQTARLLAPVMVVVAGLVAYRDARLRRYVPALLAAAALVAAPYALHLVLHTGQMTARFSRMAIWNEVGAGTAAKRFVDHYWQHLLSTDFLFWSGDPNFRHNVGFGLLPLWFAIPMLAGVRALWRRRKTLLGGFVLALLPLTAIPASLVHDGWPHAGRMLHLVPLAVMLAALGIADLLSEFHLERWGRRKALLVGAVLLCVPVPEATLLLHRYFRTYPAPAQVAFDAGKGRALQAAFGARKGLEPLFVPDEYFWWDGISLKFWGNLDPVAYRTAGFAGLGIFKASEVSSYPRGALVVTPGGLVPFSPDTADLVGVSPSLADGSALWKVFRVR